MTAARNVIAGNNINISINGTGSTGNMILGNFIGTNASGTLALGSSEHGILVIHAPDNIIGGSSVEDRNIIYGSLFIAEAEATGNKIEGNFIGTDVTGMLGLNYTGPGINVHKGGNNLIIGNVIAANANGINFEGGTSGNFVHGNYIGTNADGSSALGNSEEGIRIGGGSASNIIGSDGDGVNDIAERNLISGNNSNGIFIADDGSDQNKITGNYIGTDVTGTIAIPNGANGVIIASQLNQVGGINEGEGNLISGNIENGIWILSAAEGNVVEGNLIGTNIDGDEPLGSAVGIKIDGSGNTIGGSNVGSKNIISGNEFAGMSINGNDNTIRGNVIGLNLAGDAAIPNGNGIDISGVENIIGGSEDGFKNVISGNSSVGITLVGDKNKVQGNYIGVDALGTAPMPNEIHGIEIASSNQNKIGGMEENEGNIISGNGGDGIFIGPEGNEVSIQGNIIRTQ